MIKREIYEKLSDTELVLRYRDGDSEAADFLVYKYKNLVRMCVRPYFLVGADTDDLIQEGMIGIYKAIRSYNVEKNVTFMSFASLCISRHILTAVATYNSNKNSPLNSSLSLDAPMVDENGKNTFISETIVSTSDGNPEDIYIEKEQAAFMIANLFSNLSKMERQVLELFIEGLSYTEIAQTLDKSPKSIDNALQRIKTKLLSKK